jgi:hypothetical protein
MDEHESNLRGSVCCRARGFCEFCGHVLFLDKQAPLPGMDSLPDGTVDLCVNECFCSYGGCKPEPCEVLG